ncbi:MULTISPECIES: hypothetical protein [Psychrilyobacter]|uniref:Uncharacterized protein n=1 Tax=Psychrilyobacter piezotolerans TaxID=2293438 RepID=A0ABX9KDH4_9FUSO|nr:MULTISPECIES: hypothetical protein [Psychrilyobacter]MCS5421919.1 hypothetical protein [Psychrilyobacter sp. S5]NDI79247.1 hypothetical protein [Psychrilyobacter piezotolerans]RDE58830.1 hypothetical protein DV867_15235 [Psychrilyobacter sp. S5]REI39326.1 hypothetical protein DYH56_15235 [Psychrilyobacter piezotolerans]
MYTDKKFNDLLVGQYSQLSQDIWAFLKTRESLIKMETATYLKKPAVTALQKDLINNFPLKNHVKLNRFKQLIGAMVRDILSDHGYVIQQHEITVNPSDLFVKATRYKKSAG